jgi:hypothetical protein
MEKLSDILETYIREEPGREAPPKSERITQLEEFAHNKGKKLEVIKAWTEISEHPQAEDLKSPVGSAFDEEDLDDEMKAAYEAVGEGGMIYASFEGSFWIRHKGQLIRVM